MSNETSIHGGMSGRKALPKQAGKTDLDQIRVLHVDDQAEFTALSGKFLPRVDDRIEVISEKNARYALANLLIADNEIDCVVSDYEMPSVGGDEFLEAVRRYVGHIPFIFFTSYEIDEMSESALVSGMTSHIRKGGQEQYEKLADCIVTAVEREGR